MAALFSEPATETYFPTMGRGDEQRSQSPKYRQPSSSSRQRVPPSPRFHPADATSSRASAELYSAPSAPASTTQNEDTPLRKAFASQQNFATASNPQRPSQNPRRSNTASQDHYLAHEAGHLASPADSSSPVTRSAWSADDLSRYGGTTIKVRDLAHIQSFASEDFLQYRGSSSRRRTENEQPLKYEISAMPITDVIEMVAGLLTKITTTNDRQHENLHRPIPSAEAAANMPGLTSSVLAFHGKNVPSITILSYLSRIHKYCPTTYEVFLSLLVYFDRMTERVNAGPMQEMRRASSDRNYSRPSTGVHSADDEMEIPKTPISGGISEEAAKGHYATPPDDDQIPYLSHFFVVDSFNIHRIVIAGVTCASKFFSDVFYTNSRYAKVGGLPLAELNHLELQFLLLNDFRLSVPVEELEAYGTMLVEFYAREVIAQRQQQEQNELPSDLADSDDDAPMTAPRSP